MLPHATHTELYNNPPRNHRLPAHLPSIASRVRRLSKRYHLLKTDHTTDSYRSRVSRIPDPHLGAVVHVPDDYILHRGLERWERSRGDREVYRTH